MTSLDEDTWGVAKFVFDDTDAGLPVDQRHRRHLLLRGCPVPATAARRRDRHRRPARASSASGTACTSTADSPVTENPEAPFGKDFDDPANLTFWWSLGAVGHVAARPGQRGRGQRVRALGHHRVRRHQTARRDQRLRPRADPRSGSRNAHAVINFGFLSEANTYAYREPEGVAGLRARPPLRRDARPGPRLAGGDRRAGARLHQPPRHRRRPEHRVADDRRPGYWTGEASMPALGPARAHRRPHLPAGVGRGDRPAACGRVFGYRPYTHAYVPQDHFDEVVQDRQLDDRRQVAAATSRCGRGGRRRGGPTTRRCVATNGMVQAVRPRRRGRRRQRVDRRGRHTTTTAIARRLRRPSITAVDPSVVRDDAGFAVTWTSPSSGNVDFSSTGAFLVEGDEAAAERPSPARVAVGRHRAPVAPVQPDCRRLDLELRLRHDGPSTLT